MKKEFAKPGTALKKIAAGIKSGKYYTNQVTAYKALGFEEMTVDVNAAEFDIDVRHEVQTVDIPKNKRGNLRAYAGKTVEVICTYITRGSARIHFYIRESK